jgi:hypothetical protein
MFAVFIHSDRLLASVTLPAGASLAMQASTLWPGLKYWRFGPTGAVSLACVSEQMACFGTVSGGRTTP